MEVYVESTKLHQAFALRICCTAINDKMLKEKKIA